MCHPRRRGSQLHPNSISRRNCHQVLELGGVYFYFASFKQALGQLDDLAAMPDQEVMCPNVTATAKV